MIAKRLCLLALLLALLAPDTSYAKKKKRTKKSHKPAAAAVYRTKSRRAAPPPADLQESAPPVEAAPAPEKTAEPTEPAETVEPAPTAAPAAPSGKAERFKGNPLPYVQRNIVVPRGMLRVDGGPADFAFLMASRGFIIGKNLSGGGFGAQVATPSLPSTFVLGNATRYAQQATSGGGGSEVGVLLGLGGAFGIIDKLEAGVLILPVQFAGPLTGVHYERMQLYSRYQLLDGDFQIAAQAGFWIPTYSGTFFTLEAGAPMLVRLGNRMRIDTGAMFAFNFPSGHTNVGLQIPGAFNFGITDQIFVGARTGIGVYDFSNKGSFYIPFSLQGGMTMMDGMLDILSWFGWPNGLIFPGSDGEKFTAVGWQIGVGANFWMQLL